MSSNGLRFLAKALLDNDELEWFQAEIDERAAWFRSLGAHECGWVGEYIGPTANFGWDIKATAGVLSTRSTVSSVPETLDRVRSSSSRPYLGVDANGRVLEVEPDAGLFDAADAAVTVPNDGVWRTLIARWALRQRERGTLTITGGSTTLVGVGTQFTRYSDDATRPTKIRIDGTDNAAGNEGTYLVDSITSDTELELREAPPNDASGVNYRVQGRFFNGTPADPDIHNNAHVTWEVVTRTATRPTDGALIAFDVKRTAGVLARIDRRRANLYRQIRPDNRCFALMPLLTVTHETGATLEDAAQVVRDSVTLVTGGGVGTLGLGVSIAPASTGSNLAGLSEDQATGLIAACLYNDGVTRRVRVKTFAPVNTGTAWDNPDGGSAVDVVTGAGITDCEILAVPSASGATHLCFYCDSSGIVQMKASADNGASWGSATAIWNPPGAVTVTRIDAVLTRTGRIVLVGLYSTGTARCRYVYSDDLGATWTTNANAGIDIGGDSTTLDVAIAEDDRGNLWTVTVEDQGGANGLRLYRGQAEGNPTPDGNEQSDGWKVGPEASCDMVDVFAMPNGLVGIVTSEHDTAADSTIRFVETSHNWAILQRVLVSHANKDGNTTSCPVGVGVTAAGVVVVGWLETLDASHYVKLTTFPCVPVGFERAWSWFGGI